MQGEEEQRHGRVCMWGEYKGAADPEWALHAIKDIKQHCKNVFMRENLQYCTYSCEYPCVNERLQQCTLGRCHPSPAFPTEQDWTSFADWGWEGRLRLTSPLNQGCIELEMDEVVDETHAGRTCDFHLVHSHPPNPLHAHCTFHPPKEAVLLSKRLKIMMKREMGLPCDSDQAEKQCQGVGSHGKLWQEGRE